MNVFIFTHYSIAWRWISCFPTFRFIFLSFFRRTSHCFICLNSFFLSFCKISSHFRYNNKDFMRIHALLPASCVRCPFITAQCPGVLSVVARGSRSLTLSYRLDACYRIRLTYNHFHQHFQREAELAFRPARMSYGSCNHFTLLVYWWQFYCHWNNDNLERERKGCWAVCLSSS